MYTLRKSIHIRFSTAIILFCNRYYPILQYIGTIHPTLHFIIHSINFFFSTPQTPCPITIFYKQTKPKLTPRPDPNKLSQPCHTKSPRPRPSPNPNPLSPLKPKHKLPPPLKPKSTKQKSLYSFY